jgi:amidohydrolase
MNVFSMTLIKNIKKFSEELFPEILDIRRYLHSHPELSFKEDKTSAYICEKLDQLNIPYRKGIAGTGIVAEITGKEPKGRIIALRADMDALPIQEENQLEYKSQNDRVMHACGHDAHIASLLGSSMILMKLRNEFSGKVKLVFQPGEEKAPGGARMMLEDDLFKGEEPDVMIAQHVYPSMLSGQVGFREGIYMASCDEIYLKIRGKGGHAAMPHLTTDSVLIASHILVALQQIVSRHAEASIPTVLSFGRVIADGAVNVIPDEVTIEGTFRTMDESWRKEAHHRMTNMAKSIAESMGGQCELKIVEGYPVLKNDPGITRKSLSVAREFLGDEMVHDLDIRMTAEDFAFFADRYPAVLYRLGVRESENQTPHELHTPNFNIKEDALVTGMGLMAYLAIAHLSE